MAAQSGGKEAEMLSDLIVVLQNAKTAAEKEKAYRQLEKVGMDRMTADIIAAEMEDSDEIQSKNQRNALWRGNR